jgi:hypothetical protein
MLARELMELIRDRPGGMDEKYKELLADYSIALDTLGFELTEKFARDALAVRNGLRADLHGPSSGDLPFSFSRKEQVVLEGVVKLMDKLHKEIGLVSKGLKSASKKIDSIVL